MYQNTWMVIKCCVLFYFPCNLTLLGLNCMLLTINTAIPVLYTVRLQNYHFFYTHNFNAEFQPVQSRTKIQKTCENATVVKKKCPEKIEKKGSLEILKLILLLTDLSCLTNTEYFMWLIDKLYIKLGLQSSCRILVVLLFLIFF